MSKLILSLSAFIFFSFSFTVNSHSNFDDELLEKRCKTLVEQLNYLEKIQHKFLCKEKLASAARQIDTSAIYIHFQNYKDAESFLLSSIKNMNFAVTINCVMKSDIILAKNEALDIKNQII